MTYEQKGWAGTVKHLELREQYSDDIYRQKRKYFKPVYKTKVKNGIWWIDQILISLSAILFVFTVAAQTWIYFANR